MKRALAAIAGAAALAPAWVWACPSCATREGPGWTTFAMVGGMIAVPYAVATVAIRVVRRLERQG